MKLGFTGTAHGTGATPAQVATLCRLLADLRPAELHHGASPNPDCADWQADQAATEAGIPTVLWPPDDPNSDAMMRRNQQVVDAVDLLIACPHGFVEVLRSGTWATVRRARKKGIPVWVIWPDGGLQRQEVR